MNTVTERLLLARLKSAQGLKEVAHSFLSPVSYADSTMHIDQNESQH